MHFRETSNGTRSTAFAMTSPENRHGVALLAYRSLAAAIVIILTPSLAAALDHCAAKFRRKDGVVTIAAVSVHGQLRWDSKERNIPEPVPEALCNGQGDTGINCTLSAANQVPPPAPPADCVVRLLDDASECIAYVRGCVPGERRVIPCLRVSDDGKEVIYQGCNVHIRNALGATATKDATGNLIIGWNESVGTSDRSGSHNVVIGQQHSWSATGGIVAGIANSISAESASILGGEHNRANGFGATILGGGWNTASGEESTVSGGSGGMASGLWSSVAGGDGGLASGESSFVGGGASNWATGEVTAVVGGSSSEASGDLSTVAGGVANVADGTGATVAGGESNVATAGETSWAPTVVGGSMNTASEEANTVVGGDGNVATGFASTVTGGLRNSSRGNESTVSGGFMNVAEGRYSTVGGGAHRTASGESDWVAGSLFEEE